MKIYKIGLLIVSLIILILIVWYSNPTLVFSLLQKSNKTYILYGILITTISILFRVSKWFVLLEKVSFLKTIPIQMFGITVSNFTPGKLAEPIKSIILKITDGIPVSVSILSVIWERLIDVIVLVILSLFAFQAITLSSNFFVLGIVGIGVFVSLIIVVISVLINQRLGFWVFGIAKKLPLLNRLSDDFMKTFYKTKIDMKRVVACFVLTIIPWVLDGVVLYLVFLSFGVNLSPLLLAGMIAISTIIGIASFLPGGIGSFEVIIVVLLGFVSIEHTLAVTVILLFRFITFWYGILLGGLSFVYLSKKADIKNVF